MSYGRHQWTRRSRKRDWTFCLSMGAFGTTRQAHADREEHGCNATTLMSAGLRYDDWALGRKRPVVLVGHEFGGDVIKSLVMEAKGIVTNTRPPRSSTPDWEIMSRAEAFVRNVVQIIVYASQRVHDNWELNKDGSIDDSCSLFLCNPKSRFVEGIEPFSSWEEKAVWSLDSPGEPGDVWKPPNKRHESYSLQLKSLLQARHEEHWKSPISADLHFLLNRFSFVLYLLHDGLIQQHDHLPSLESVLQDSIGEIIVTLKVQVPEQRIQFLFGNAKSMANVVGVGLDFATVYLSRENLITIEKINQLEWEQLWREALQDGSSFYEPILIHKIRIFWHHYFGFLVTSDGSYLTVLNLCAYFFMTRNLLQLNAMAIHDCLQGGSSCLGMPSAKDKIEVKTETCERPSLEFLWDVLGCVGKHGVGCKCRHGEGDEDTIGDGGSATPGTNIVGQRVAQKRDHEDMPSASEGHHEGRESTCAEGERNYGHGDTPSEGGEGGGRNIAGEKDYHNQDDENVHKVGGKDGEGHAKSEKDPSTGILECSWMERFSFLNFKGGEGEHGGKESTSGGSGGGDAPGECGEGGSNPDGGDDDRPSHHDASGNPSEGTLSETLVVVRVHPKYQPSNCHWEEKGEHIDPNDQDLKKVNITPRLELRFLKEGDSKLLTTKMSVSFDIAAAKPKPGDEDVNNNRFGWFQKCLSVSLQCLHVNSAQLGHDVFADTKDTTKTNKTNTQTTSGAWQHTANLSVTPPFVKAGLTVGKPTTTTTTLQEDSMETPTEHIRGGFLAQDMSERGPRHRLSYNFVYQNPPKDIKDTQGNNRSMYLNTGMCHTVYSSISGTWDDLDDEEASEYEFRAQREVCELTKDARSKKKSLMRKLLQIYEMKLYINHKMTHIEKLVDTTLTRRPDKCELVGVDTQPVIDSDGASSSAQQRI
ncbi:hypothetical protein CY35_09G105000 [Sphagnum magellanicum]|nr:hypothetical protein CY35_09G105000 [Sphagnum magellanicum]KAH9553170.1 hypothetical protein CY35_09G105000 [Sphagnum magellanicum]